MTERTRESDYVNPNMTHIPGPGSYRFSFVHDGEGREYYVYVPRSYRGKPVPMLIALHEEHGGPATLADDWEYQLTRKAKEDGFIIVFPGGYQGSWNAGSCCGPSQNHNVDEVGFIREVISRVERQANIDPQRIFATGFSNGAMMSWRLACEAPEIRAIAPVAGTDNTSECHPSHPVGIIQFHAADDRDIPFNGGKGRPAIGRVEFVSVPASQAKWVAINHASPTATRVLSVKGAFCDLHSAQAAGAPVKLCVTEKGRHGWPAKSKTIRANDLMWDFFSSL